MKLLKLIDAVCIAGSNKNEDSIGYGDDFIFVIDGATGLRGVNIMGMRSDAEWFSKRLAERSNRTLLTSYCIEPIYIDL